VNLFRRPGHPYWWYDFTVRGERFRGSTKETRKTAAFGKAATLFGAIAEGKSQTNQKAPVLSAFVVRFMSYVDNAKLADKTKSYLRNGWRLLEQTNIADMRLNHITAEDVDALPLPGGPYNINCALKTLRRMLHKAEEWGLIAKVPKLKLSKELGRTLRLDQEAERKLLAAADSLLERGAWTRKMHDTLRDVVVLVRDTGMRNKKELYRARIEDIDWNNRVFFIPDSKTDNGRRFVPISDRALELLKARCGERREGWVFTAFSASGHLTTMGKKFREARREAGLPEKLVLYCGRHDYGTRVLQGTGNLAVVMRAMGHGSPSTAMKYQHPELEQVRRVLNGTNGSHSRTGIVMAQKAVTIPNWDWNGTFYGTVTKQ
jgi:integrase